MSRMRTLAAILPPGLHAKLLRHWGHDIAPGAKVGPLALVQVDHLVMGEGSRIAPLSRVRGKSVRLDARASIESLVTITTNRLRLGKDASIARLSIVAGDPTRESAELELGEHARIFPFCWIDPDHGVRIGNRAGVGGHTLIFTHGSWSNYFKGAPVAFGPVTIEDRVWLPWRVFVMPNVTIGADSIIGAGSVVTSDVPTHSLAAGSPAKVLRQPAYRDIDDDGFRARVDTVLAEFADQEPEASVRLRAQHSTDPEIVQGALVLGRDLAEADVASWKSLGASVVDLTRERAWLVDGDQSVARFVSWLSRYGVRADREEAQREEGARLLGSPDHG